MKVIFENADLIVIDKPAGIQVEKDKFGYPSIEAMLYDYLKQQKREPFVGVVHRLDRPVGGLMVFAKKKSILKQLNTYFRENKVKKIYTAIVEKTPNNDKATLLHWLKRDETQKKTLVFDKKVSESIQAILKYTKTQEHTLEIELITGKFHQIRAQLAAIGCPIVGDALYGSTLAYLPHQIKLRCTQLHFPNPMEENKLLSFHLEER